MQHTGDTLRISRQWVGWCNLFFSIWWDSLIKSSLTWLTIPSSDCETSLMNCLSWASGLSEVSMPSMQIFPWSRKLCCFTFIYWGESTWLKCLGIYHTDKTFCVLLESHVFYFHLNLLGHSHNAHDECWLPAAAASTNGELLSGGNGQAQSAWSQLTLKSSAPKNYAFPKF